MGDLTPITTIIFDIGGVVVKSPLLGINKFEKAHGLPHDYLNVAITARGAQGAFQRLEVGELQLSEFYAQFGAQMSDLVFNNLAYTKFCSKSRRTYSKLPTNLQVDGKQLWTQMMAEASTPNLPIIKLIKRLRELERYRIAALTNNFQIPAGKTDDDQEALGSAPDEVKNLFDEFIESSQVGLRKPDPKFFEYALKLLKVRSPKEVVFLDDLGINLKAAEKLGINTIKVGIHDVKPALEKLEKFLPDVDLSDIIHSAAKL
ncbi:hypothetical protein MJO28_012898 [Puccinia striiformis f. sp. tritici]|uniref:Uncharacterized protein n=4 Tax=Puccinia striiformis TaxID=27350 RepID=A0A0L0VN93_9BASI|nr:hypothetical protein Pst134EB_025278 [Puccinia striiformis f. sp. tritici]KAI7940613.1 hypothetical protein MJO28_012898 [Puccinia striiformis f. sp. tritici]KNF00460.1 hypothetical protein PSTG_06391 [Puccinia striiformis f. sp. tritici PST-78]POV98744.1 hypothetical protein PSHT_13879 [Puccinia striiformis]POW16994.1 hypothetical protein PSTT_00852 [Puccinia striiformis]